MNEEPRRWKLIHVIGVAQALFLVVGIPCVAIAVALNDDSTLRANGMGELGGDDGLLFSLPVALILWVPVTFAGLFGPLQRSLADATLGARLGANGLLAAGMSLIATLWGHSLCANPGPAFVGCGLPALLTVFGTGLVVSLAR